MRIRKPDMRTQLFLILGLLLGAGLNVMANSTSGQSGSGGGTDLGDWADLKLWYKHPAAKWTEALPVGNGRLGAMVFGRTDEERIQLNEETYWSGGPYSQTTKGGYKALPEISSGCRIRGDREAIL